jgi:trehalose transport system permease protein
VNIHKLTGWIISFLFLILLLFPLYIMFKMAVSQPQAIFKADPSYLIEYFTLDHFKSVFASGEVFYGPLRKSIITALSATLLSLLIAAPAAYAISRFNARVGYVFVVMIFITRMVPEVSIALPIAINFMKLGLFDTTLGLVLAHMIRILPVSCFILVSVFSEFPVTLEHQAMIDGCTRFGAVVKVVLPLCFTGLAIAALFSFILSWDEFIYASYLSLANPTMPIKMYYYISRGNIFTSATYAVIITVPVLILTFSLQRYIKPEYLSGAVKG